MGALSNRPFFQNSWIYRTLTALLGTLLLILVTLFYRLYYSAHSQANVAKHLDSPGSRALHRLNECVHECRFPDCWERATWVYSSSKQSSALNDASTLQSRLESVEWSPRQRRSSLFHAFVSVNLSLVTWASKTTRSWLSTCLWINRQGLFWQTGEALSSTLLSSPLQTGLDCPMLSSWNVSLMESVWMKTSCSSSQIKFCLIWR